MSDAYYVGAWHRYIQRRARGGAGLPPDAGISLIEILVAIVLLATALIGTAGEVAGYVRQQAVEKAQVVANHLADSWFEYAESLEHAASIEATNASNANITPVSNPTNPTTTTINGVTYSSTTTPHFCAANSQAGTVVALSSCPTTNPGAVKGNTTIYDTITITWSVGGKGHRLTQTRNLADNSYYNPGDTVDPGGNGLSNCTRAGTVVAGSDTLTLTPATVQTVSGSAGPAFVDGGSGALIQNPDGTTTTGISAVLQEKGLSNTTDTSNPSVIGPATCVPLYWTDGNGTHTVDMHTSQSACAVTSSNFASAPPLCTYTATVPASLVSYPNIPSPYNAPIQFCAYLSGAGTCPVGTSTDQTVAAKQFYVNARPTVLNCSVPAMSALLGKTNADYPISCTSVTDLPITDTINVTSDSSNTPSVTLRYVSGSTWTGVLPKGSSIKNSLVGTVVHWTFTATRQFDNEPATFSTGSFVSSTVVSNVVLTVL